MRLADENLPLFISASDTFTGRPYKLFALLLPAQYYSELAEFGQESESQRRLSRSPDSDPAPFSDAAYVSRHGTDTSQLCSTRLPTMIALASQTPMAPMRQSSSRLRHCGLTIFINYARSAHASAVDAFSVNAWWRRRC